MQPVSFPVHLLEAFIHFIRYVVIQRLMKPRRIVEAEVGIYTGLQVFHCFVAFKVDVLVLETSPKMLNSDVVQSPVFSVHADLDVVIDKNFDEYIRCKLASLVCVPYSSIVSLRRFAYCSASIVLNTRQLKTFLEKQSIIAIK